MIYIIRKNIIRNDQHIMLYAAVEMETRQELRFNDIRYSLRCLARLVKEYRNNNPDARAADLITCKKFDDVVKAAKTLTGYRGPRDIDVPNTFCKFGYCLRKLALILRGVALRENDEEKKTLCRDFLELYESTYVKLANSAKAVYQNRKGNAPQQELPLDEDMRIFRIHCVNEINRFDYLFKMWIS